ncbi:MAG: TIGR02996 domain-containing protein [Myxococcota bacterium]
MNHPGVEEALRQAIAVSPDDQEARWAYARHLEAQGNPRGRFIQLQLERPAHKAPSSEERRLLQEHQRSWFGFGFCDRFTFEVENGFVVEATLRDEVLGLDRSAGALFTMRRLNVATTKVRGLFSLLHCSELRHLQVLRGLPARMLRFEGLPFRLTALSVRGTPNLSSSVWKGLTARRLDLLELRHWPLLNGLRVPDLGLDVSPAFREEEPVEAIRQVLDAVPDAVSTVRLFRKPGEAIRLARDGKAWRLELDEVQNVAATVPWSLSLMLMLFPFVNVRRVNEQASFCVTLDELARAPAYFPTTSGPVHLSNAGQGDWSALQALSSSKVLHVRLSDAKRCLTHVVDQPHFQRLVVDDPNTRGQLILERSGRGPFWLGPEAQALTQPIQSFLEWAASTRHVRAV